MHVSAVTKDPETVASLLMRDGGFSCGSLERNQARGSEVPDTMWRPQRDEHHPVDKQRGLAVSGALGSSCGSEDGLCFEGASFQSRRQMCL